MKALSQHSYRSAFSFTLICILLLSALNNFLFSNKLSAMINYLYKSCLTIFLSFVLIVPVLAQDDVMMQGFYWDVPVDEQNLNGFWWDTLTVKAPDWGAAGFTGVWVPSPAKGNWGIIDMGYGIFDHYDLGNYNQKGSVQTRFGSKQELLDMVSAMNQNGIEVYADIILNHIYTNEDQREVNPAVKSYIDNEAIVGCCQNVPFPTNEVVWVIPNAQPGDYYIQISGYHLDYNAGYEERAYNLNINWDGSSTDNSNIYWESEPNNGNSEYNEFPGSGKNIWAHINYEGDIDEFKVTVNQTHDIEIRLESRREVNGELVWASQENGYRVRAVWHNGNDLSGSVLEAQTNTGIEYVTKTGGEPQLTWNYSHFHPVDSNDYLQDGGFEDAIRPRWKLFGNDLHTFDMVVQQRLIDWGIWLTNTVGFEGYRFDFVRGVEEEFIAEWLNNMPRRPDDSQFYAVGEYFTGHKYRLKQWVDDISSFQHNGNTADIDVFDFPLKNTLTDMANMNGGDFNMSWLNHAGMVRDDGGNALPGTMVNTFVENHDTGKEHDKWLWRDWDMAYAYILFAEGRPTIFYPQYYGITQEEMGGGGPTVTAPKSLQDDINLMIHIRSTYLDGDMIVLSQNGNPWPSGDVSDVYVARRAGNAQKPGAILVLNNHESQTKGLWVDNTISGSGYDDWSNQELVNATSGNEEKTQVYSDGRVWVEAPPRGYAVYVPDSEYVSYNKIPETAEDYRNTDLPKSFELLGNYPNPFNPSTNIQFHIPENGNVQVDVYNAIGQHMGTILNSELQAGPHNVTWDSGSAASGIYFYIVQWNSQSMTQKMMLIK